MATLINQNQQFSAQRILNWCIAAIWIVNGLFCKVLGFVPRHEQIVKRILAPHNSHKIVVLIGISEICLAIWVFSNFKTKLNSVIQILVVSAMNVIEFTYAPDLLLWGKFNILFAFLFILVVFINGFILPNINEQS